MRLLAPFYHRGNVPLLAQEIGVLLDEPAERGDNHAEQEVDAELDEVEEQYEVLPDVLVHKPGQPDRKGGSIQERELFLDAVHDFGRIVGNAVSIGILVTACHIRDEPGNARALRHELDQSVPVNGKGKLNGVLQILVDGIVNVQQTGQCRIGNALHRLFKFLPGRVNLFKQHKCRLGANFKPPDQCPVECRNGVADGLRHGIGAHEVLQLHPAAQRIHELLGRIGRFKAGLQPRTQVGNPVIEMVGTVVHVQLRRRLLDSL